ncbi:MAG: hypothetical protein HY822_24780 [Acidobacteria bacterium]|nr:hypothetical protein [Acidobacteriota bacterium]
MRHTPLALANKVSIALLALEPGGELARGMGVGGWPVPLDYQAVHECLQELGATPYEHFGQVTAMEAVRQHSTKVLLGLSAIILALAIGCGLLSRLWSRSWSSAGWPSRSGCGLRNSFGSRRNWRASTGWRAA